MAFKIRPVVHTQEDFMVGDNERITSQWEHRNPPRGCFLLRMDNDTQDPSFHYSNNGLFKKSEGRKKLQRKIDKEKKKKGNTEQE